MSLYTNLQDKSLEARKAKDEVAKTIYGVLLGEISRTVDPGQEISDDLVSKVAEKTISSIETTLAAGGPNDTLTQEKALLSQFVLAKVDVEVIKTFATEFIVGNPGLTIKNMGQVMAVIKSRFGNAFDAAAISAYLKSTLPAAQ